MERHLPSACLLAALLAMAFYASAQTVSLTTGGKQLRIKVGEAAALPTDFPADVVLPQPYVVTRVERSDQKTSLELDTSGEVDAIAEQFRAGMLVNGWAPAPVRQPATGNAQAWEKDTRVVIAWLAPGPAGVHLQVQLLPQH